MWTYKIKLINLTWMFMWLRNQVSPVTHKKRIFTYIWHTLKSRHVWTQEIRHMLFTGHKLAENPPVIGGAPTIVILSVCLVISSCSTVQAHLPENTERKPANQTGSQLGRKRSSEGVRGCLEWFMHCSRMLNEFRVHYYYRNWLNGHCLLFSDTYLDSLNDNNKNAVFLHHIIMT